MGAPVFSNELLNAFFSSSPVPSLPPLPPHPPLAPPTLPHGLCFLLSKSDGYLSLEQYFKNSFDQAP